MEEEVEKKYWKYEECKLTKEEYEEYLSDENKLSTLIAIRQFEDLKIEQEMQSVTNEINTNEIIKQQEDAKMDILLMIMGG
ncbi:MAG: hypothetical protein R3Y54_13570 [Eubacteriales bacterium]